MASARSAQGSESAAEPWSATVRVRRTHDRLGNGPIAMPEETLVKVRSRGARLAVRAVRTGNCVLSMQVRARLRVHACTYARMRPGCSQAG